VVDHDDYFSAFLSGESREKGLLEKRSQANGRRVNFWDTSPPGKRVFIDHCEATRPTSGTDR
jgi:hypothetical protein